MVKIVNIYSYIYIFVEHKTATYYTREQCRLQSLSSLIEPGINQIRVYSVAPTHQSQIIPPILDSKRFNLVKYSKYTIRE